MIGIYGGTFNPVHLGHLRAAEEVAEILSLSRMLFVPSARPPHKDDAEQIIAPPDQRLAWLESALADNPLFVVDAIEIERPGASYIVDTLTALGERYPDEELVFVVGQDAFRDMGNWREPEKIFAMTHIAMTTRPPAPAAPLSSCLPKVVENDFEIARDEGSARHRKSGTWIRQLEISALDISATAIRARLARGSSIRYLVPAPALEAIVSGGCYTHAMDPSPQPDSKRKE
jgi:nicotinate-nucleotide adenylyltransferase